MPSVRRTDPGKRAAVASQSFTRYQTEAMKADAKADRLARQKGGPIGAKEYEVYSASRKKRIEMADADAQYADQNAKRADKAWAQAINERAASKKPATKKGK